MKISIQKLRTRLSYIFKQHQAFVVLVFLFVIAAWVILRLLSLSSLEPNQQYIDDQTRTFQTVEFDQKAVKEIEALQDSGVAVPGTQLPNNRQNPFNE